jgi:ribosomal protein S18 acetylase RimI-like enzyme
MPIAIRRATTEDIPLLVNMMQEFYAESNFMLDRQWATTSFSKFLSDNSHGAAWIGSHHSDPAGYVVMTIRFSMEYGGLDAFIDDLFVRVPYRRQGLGRILLDELFAECQRRKVLAVHVEVGQNNIAANALYSTCGLRLRDDCRQMLTRRLSDN